LAFGKEIELLMAYDGRREQ